MHRVSRKVFESLVREALEGLPAALRERMSNLEVVVEDEPTDEELEEAGEDDLFGLYRGVPLTERDSQYDRELPDVITVFQAPHEWECDTFQELREEVRTTVRHEVAHHFGIDDDRLEELGAY